MRARTRSRSGSRCRSAHSFRSRWPGRRHRAAGRTRCGSGREVRRGRQGPAARRRSWPRRRTADSGSDASSGEQHSRSLLEPPAATPRSAPPARRGRRRARSCRGSRVTASGRGRSTLATGPMPDASHAASTAPIRPTAMPIAVGAATASIRCDRATPSWLQIRVSASVSRVVRCTTAAANTSTAASADRPNRRKARTTGSIELRTRSVSTDVTVGITRKPKLFSRTEAGSRALSAANRASSSARTSSTPASPSVRRKASSAASLAQSSGKKSSFNSSIDRGSSGPGCVATHEYLADNCGLKKTFTVGYRSSGRISSGNTPMPTTSTGSLAIGSGSSMGVGPLGCVGRKVTSIRSPTRRPYAAAAPRFRKISLSPVAMRPLMTVGRSTSTYRPSAEPSGNVTLSNSAAAPGRCRRSRRSAACSSTCSRHPESFGPPRGCGR